eukprot:6176867-Pleurochrysis_carterae.AAC.2
MDHAQLCAHAGHAHFALAIRCDLSRIARGLWAEAPRWQRSRCSGLCMLFNTVVAELGGARLHFLDLVQHVRFLHTDHPPQPHQASFEIALRHGRACGHELEMIALAEQVLQMDLDVLQRCCFGEGRERDMSEPPTWVGP